VHLGDLVARDLVHGHDEYGCGVLLGGDRKPISALAVRSAPKAEVRTSFIRGPAPSALPASGRDLLGMRDHLIAGNVSPRLLAIALTH
jgi:hypothetical protein